MKVSEMYPSKYLKSADLGDEGPRTLTMDGVEIENIEGDDVPVLYFRGERKGLRLNKTNGLVIAKLYGDDTDDWAGQRIELYSVPVQNPRGEMVDGIRVRTPKRSDAAAERPVRRRTVREAPPEPEEGEESW